jgi:inner membrane protein
MDPVAHTLVGATLAQAGLKSRTALGTTTLVVGANLPDIDVLSYFWGGETALGFRRGLTHGALAWIVLPLAFTGCILLWKSAMRWRGADMDRVSGRQVLLLATIAVATHPLLDLLNVYGIRLLMPFSGKWYYGDTLFIIDPWLWMILAIGLWLSRKIRKAPAVALAAATAYVAGMAVSNVVARSHVQRWAQSEGVVVDEMMVAPLAVTPFARRIVVADDAGYWVGMFEWPRAPGLELERLPYASTSSGLPNEVAVHEPNIEKFLTWARFPYYLTVNEAERTMLYIGDARYSVDPQHGWATTGVPIAVEPR